MDDGYGDFCEDFGVDGGLWTLANLVEFLASDDEEDEAVADEPPSAPGAHHPCRFNLKCAHLIRPVHFVAAGSDEWGWDDSAPVEVAPTPAPAPADEWAWDDVPAAQPATAAEPEQPPALSPDPEPEPVPEPEPEPEPEPFFQAEDGIRDTNS
eukprot:COSAG02_NODE_9221_length_2285_cov_2.142726_1_plen_153_part_00